jgi:predicted metalloprotease
VRWKPSKRQDDLIDLRGGGGGGRRRVGLPMAGGGLGMAGILIVVLLQVLGGGSASSGGFDIPGAFETGGQDEVAPIPPGQDPERDLKEFSLAVLTRANDMWEARFRREGREYQRAKLVLYRSGVDTACGSASSAVGPFYCPGDRRVYIDLGFYDDMSERLGAPGDFAWAYVIAHEVGHHIQRLSGTESQVRRLQREDPGSANDLSVRMELQADCYSGVWADSVALDLEEGDVAEAMEASEAVGDDRLQRQAGRAVDPESFTHGSSAQRTKWFETGRREGDPAACDTFGVDAP